MGKPKFTPGPWWVTPDNGYYNIHSSEGEIIGCEGLCEYDDTHLIAAAPDLYAALESVQESLDILLGETGLPEGSVVRGVVAGAFAVTDEMIVAALAKARGENK
jgi:hypothetical protein